VNFTLEQATKAGGE